VFEGVAFPREPLKRREEFPVCAIQVAITLIAQLKIGDQTKKLYTDV
jgi:hypothetical protein